jgi:hypothetical protein
MPLHKDIASLDKSIQKKALECIAEMNADPEIKKAGYSVIILETLRDLAVQMAYAVKARIKALPTEEKTDLEWVRYFFRKAGLSWQPTEDENSRPSTWTLDSKHIDGLAFDAAPSKDGKNADWNAPDTVWERMAAIAEKNGFKAGRRWKNQDSPHFEA